MRLPAFTRAADNRTDAALLAVTSANALMAGLRHNPIEMIILFIQSMGVGPGATSFLEFASPCGSALLILLA